MPALRNRENFTFRGVIARARARKRSSKLACTRIYVVTFKSTWIFFIVRSCSLIVSLSLSFRYFFFLSFYQTRSTMFGQLMWFVKTRVLNTETIAQTATSFFNGWYFWNLIHTYLSHLLELNSLFLIPRIWREVQ